MIPKIIHYCWLSGDPVPKNLQKWMKTWKKKLPDWEFILWDKSRFDINSVEWVRQAYEAKKYAFAADYIRQYAVYTYGGFYMDMDVEVVKNLDELLIRRYVLGAETETGVEAGVFGAEKGSPVIKACLDWYEGRNFVNEVGSFNIVTCPNVMYNSISKHYKMEISSVISADKGTVTLLPKDFLTAKSGDTGIVNKTKNTYTVHHFAGSWLKQSLRTRFFHKCKTILSWIIGEELVRRIRNAIVSPYRVIPVARESIKLCASPIFGFFRTIDRLTGNNKGKKRVLLAGAKGFCAVHAAEFAGTIISLSDRVNFDCLNYGFEKKYYSKLFSGINVRFVSRFRAFSTYYDLILNSGGYSSFFRSKSTGLLYTNHAQHIYSLDGGKTANAYVVASREHPDIFLEANKYKAEIICKYRPELRNVVKWVGWKFAEKERIAVADRDTIRQNLGFKPDDIVVFIVGTWGPYNLYHSYGDRIFEVIKKLAKQYKIVLSSHYNDYIKARYGNGVVALPKGQMVDSLAKYGCIVRKFEDPWIEYMAAADVVFTDYSTLSEEAVAMGKKVIFSNFPDEVVWKHSVCFRARKYLPMVEDIDRLDEYVEKALKMHIPEEVAKMAGETYISRREYEEKVLELTKGLLGLI